MIQNVDINGDGVNCTSFTDGKWQREIDLLKEGEVKLNSEIKVKIYVYTCKDDDLTWENSPFIHNYGEEACWKCNKIADRKYKKTITIAIVKRGEKLNSEIIKEEID